MSRIVAGRFDRSIDADAALEALKREGFSPPEVDAFYVSPPGQNAMTPLGGDAPHSSEGSRRAGYGAAVGAAVGLAAGLLIGSPLRAPARVLSCGLGALLRALPRALATLPGGRR